MDESTMTETLRARCTPEMKRRLEKIAENGIGDVSDHIRFAIEQYLAAEEAKKTGVLTAPVQAS